MLTHPEKHTHAPTHLFPLSLSHSQFLIPSLSELYKHTHTLTHTHSHTITQSRSTHTHTHTHTHSHAHTHTPSLSHDPHTHTHTHTHRYYSLLLVSHECCVSVPANP